MVQQIDAKTPEVKSKEAQQIKQLAGSRVFGRPLVDAMQKDVMIKLMRDIKSNPDAYSRGRIRTASGGYTRGESLDKIADTFGMDGKDKATVERIFGNELNPVAIRALQILYENKQGRTQKRVKPASQRKQPKRKKSIPVPIIGGN